MEVRVTPARLGLLKSDALIAPLNSRRVWTSPTDAIIRDAAGEQFHDVAATALNEDSAIKAIVARRLTDHKGAFGDVIFVIDDLGFRPESEYRDRLSEVVQRGLDAAAMAGYRTVSMPVFRQNTVREQTPFADLASEVARGIALHRGSRSRLLDEIVIAFSGGRDELDTLKRALRIG